MVDVTKVYQVIITSFYSFLSGVSGSFGLSPSEGGHGGEQNHLQLPDLPLLTRPCAGTSSFSLPACPAHSTLLNCVLSED